MLKNIKTSSTYYLFIIFIIAACSLLLGCTNFASKNKITQEYKNFFNLTLDNRIKLFKTLPIEKQFDICVIDETIMKPSVQTYALEIARRGKEAIPFLLNQLQTTKDESVTEVVIKIFDFMSSLFYDLHNKQDVIKSIKKSIDLIKNLGVKERCLEMLKNIENNPIQK